MALRICRLAAIMLTALSMSVAFCHLLEMPAKLEYDGAMWLRLLQTLYPRMFGTVGAAFEAGAVISTVLLALLVRHRSGLVKRWTFLGAASVVIAHAVYWILIAPVNETMVPLTPETLPAHWTALRDRWEYSHASRAILQMIALGALVYSVLIEIPARSVEPRG